MPPHLETGYLEAMALAVREELNHERRACAVCAPGKRHPKVWMAEWDGLRKQNPTTSYVRFPRVFGVSRNRLMLKIPAAAPLTYVGLRCRFHSTLQFLILKFDNPEYPFYCGR